MRGRSGISARIAASRPSDRAHGPVARPGTARRESRSGRAPAPAGSHVPAASEPARPTTRPSALAAAIGRQGSCRNVSGSEPASCPSCRTSRRAPRFWPQAPTGSKSGKASAKKTTIRRIRVARSRAGSKQRCGSPPGKIPSLTLSTPRAAVAATAARTASRSSADRRWWR